LQKNLGGKSYTYKIRNSDDLYLSEPARIPLYGMNQIRYNDLVLSAEIRDKSAEYSRAFIEGKAEYYHTPLGKTVKDGISKEIVKEIKYFAPVSLFPDGLKKCIYLYPVIKIVLKKRKDINREAGSDNKEYAENDYWLFRLGKPVLLEKEVIKKCKDESFRLRLITSDSIFSMSDYEELSECYQ